MRHTLWNKLNINWSTCEKQVFNLQAKIAAAWLNKDYALVRQLQNELIRSYAARALAVRRVITNSGSKTRPLGGVDNVIWDDAKKIESAIEGLKNLKHYEPQPVKRVYIPKADGSKRPLGIPTMFDRAVQALYNMALVPIAECVADDRSYGLLRQ